MTEAQIEKVIELSESRGKPSITFDLLEDRRNKAVKRQKAINYSGTIVTGLKSLSEALFNPYDLINRVRRLIS